MQMQRAALTGECIKRIKVFQMKHTGSRFLVVNWRMKEVAGTFETAGGGSRGVELARRQVEIILFRTGRNKLAAEL